MSPKTTELSLDEIFSLAKKALINNGANEENADAVATTVTNAERDGSVSHGLFRIPGYIKALQSNKEMDLQTQKLKRLPLQYSGVMLKMGLLRLLTSMALKNL